jgi:N5-(cytidine 5'-diphosphoramidyl)-L-glutamine hydrolase
MKRLGITQRVENIAAYSERRDCLDQRWSVLADELGYIPIPLPNIGNKSVSKLLDSLQLDAIILSGGNSITQLNPGALDVAPERDAFEIALINEASIRAIPILGVCRGMQMINLYCGGQLSTIKGHVAVRHKLNIAPEYSEYILETVNSYHNWAIKLSDLAPDLIPIARDEQGNIEAFIYKTQAMLGIMWHPERERPFKQQDIKLIKKFLLWHEY